MNAFKAFVVMLFVFLSTVASAVTVRVVDYHAVGLTSAGYWAGYSILDVGGTQMVAINDIAWWDAFVPPSLYTDGSSWEANLYSHNDVVAGAPVAFNQGLYPFAATFMTQGLLGYITKDNLWGAGYAEMAMNTLSNGIVPPLWSYSDQVYDQQTGVRLIDVYNSMLPTLSGRNDYFIINIQAFSQELNTLKSGEFIAYAMPTPIPPAVWLFGSGLLGLVAVARARTVQK